MNWPAVPLSVEQGGEGVRGAPTLSAGALDRLTAFDLGPQSPQPPQRAQDTSRKPLPLFAVQGPPVKGRGNRAAVQEGKWGPGNHSC